MSSKNKPATRPSPTTLSQVGPAPYIPPNEVAPVEPVAVVVAPEATAPEPAPVEKEDAEVTTKVTLAGVIMPDTPFDAPEATAPEPAPVEKEDAPEPVPTSVPAVAQTEPFVNARTLLEQQRGAQAIARFTPPK